MEKDKLKLVNNFPLIIMVVVAMILIILVNIYFNIKPDKVISFNGTMVLSGDITYNLTNKQTISDDLNIETVQVYNGDYIYKRLDSYYVGVKEKKEIDYSYPAYSNDGLVLYTLNDDVNFINNSFLSEEGYSGISINYGMAYNLGDEEPINNDSYFFIDLKNSIFINTISMSVITLNNQYEISVNSPIYFNNNYINYYTFNGKKFEYNRIDDIYYDSIIKIGNLTLTYEEFLLKMNLVKPVSNDDVEIDEEIKEENDNIDLEESIPLPSYNKPQIEIEDFTTKAYYISSNIKISDPSAVITNYPVFEIYDENKKIVLKKQISNSGDFKIKGLLPNKKYQIIGKYEYKNELGINVENTFYEEFITTPDIDSIDSIILVSKVGNRYSNKIEIKNLQISNIDNEVLSGVSRITIKANDKEYNLSYSQINDLLSGKEIVVSTPKSLKSNTVYEYEIKFYDKANNELKTEGMNTGVVQTSKEAPTVSADSYINGANATVKLTTKNKDDVYIYDYKYELYSYSGYLIETDSLDYKDKEEIEMNFNNLDYSTNYILKVIGIYDLEDGNGNQNLNYEFDFTIGDIESLTVFYDTQETIVESNLISTSIYFKYIPVFERESTKIQIYLADKDGNDILNEDNSLKYLNEYSIEQFQNNIKGSYIKLYTEFKNLDSDTEYQIKTKVIVKQIEKKLELNKNLSPNIKTPAQEAYVNVIYSQLFGETLYLSFNVNDIDNKIDDKKIIIEIYDGQYSSVDEINQKHIYREVRKINESEPVELIVNNFSFDSYTIVISANPYNSKKVKKILNIKNKESENDLIVIDKTIETEFEIFQQSEINSNEMLTEINLSYYLKNSNIKFNLLDCVNNSCSIIGNINTNGVIDTVQSVEISDIANNRLSQFKRSKIDKRIRITNKKNKNHKLLLAVEKANIDLTNVKQIKYDSLESYLYLLTEIEYDTSHVIKNISSAQDFYNIPNKNSGQYVVTSNLDFRENKTAKNFNGCIDFQGYDVNLYETATSSSKLFDLLDSKGILRNININYTIDYSGVRIEGYGFINRNNGTLENFIINVEQINKNAVGTKLGLAALLNYGKIINFAVYLKSNIDVYFESCLVTYSNYSTGKISNGYISTESSEHSIIVHDDTSRHGSFAYMNSGTISNVYNLVDVLSTDTIVPNLSTIIYSNSGTLQNALSVATITKKNSNGPNVYSATNTSKNINNYYYDTNEKNLSFSNSYNKPINKSSLRNTGVLEVILNNGELIEEKKAFSIVQGYYPTVNMSSFMDDKQLLVPISFDYTQTTMDIISAEAISMDKANGSAEIGVYISNPDNLKIESIFVDNISSNKVYDVSYNENTQITYLKFQIKIEKPSDLAKSVYEINGFEYYSENSNILRKEYKVNKPRIEVSIYKPIRDYKTLISAINNNENIFFINDVMYDSSSDSEFLPKSTVVYKALFDGNEKTLDLNNTKITRGYYINGLNSAQFKNLQIKNFNIDADAEKGATTYIGFIRTTNYSTIENIDITNSKINYKYDGNQDIYVGTLTSSIGSSSINKISVNNSSIIMDDNYTNRTNISKNAYIGGILGIGSSTNVNNSYTYNLNLEANADILTGNKAMGGLAGYANNQLNVYNCYTQGSIKSNYYNVGGFFGDASSSKVDNSYSVVNITSIADYIGGIVGNYKTNSSNMIQNNMFIGNIKKINKDSLISTIVPLAGIANKNNNYDLIKNDYGYLDTITYLEFDSSNVFSKVGSEMPYLIDGNHSFVDQKIKNEKIKLEVGTNYNILATSDPSKVKLHTTNKLKINDGMNISKNLKINEISYDGNIYIYEIMPNDLYLSFYDIEMCKDKDCTIYSSETINLEFFREIKTFDDWQSISTQYAENILLFDNIEITEKTNATDKKLNKVKVNELIDTNTGEITYEEVTISSSVELNTSLIYLVNEEINNIKFKDININTNLSNEGIIKYNLGVINNCKFENITINAQGKDAIGIISNNGGYINNIKLDNITIYGNSNVGSLVGLDVKNSMTNTIYDITAKNINIVTTGSNVGGVIGSATKTLENIYLENLILTHTGNKTSNIGGLVGRGSINNSTLTTTNESTMNKIDAKGTSIGGISGTSGGTRNYVKNLQIYSSDNNYQSSSIGGITGSGTTTYSSIENLIIGYYDEDSNLHSINAINVGGMTGMGSYVQNSYIRNSKIYASQDVGGIIGKVSTSTSAITNNTVSNTDIIAAKNNVGGIVGYFYGSSGTLNLGNNVLLSKRGSSVVANNSAGGIVGYIYNDTEYMQRMKFENNFVENYEIFVNDQSQTAGGLIGKLYRTPTATELLYKDSLFYGVISNSKQYGIGYIENVNTNSPIYIGATTAYDVSVLSNFKEYVPTNIKYSSSQVNNEDELISLISSSYEYDIGYFPILKNYKYDGTQGNEDDRVEIPNDSISMENSYGVRLFSRNYSLANNNKITTTYDLYASDVNKLNIEFSDINESVYFYYEIGNYKSDVIPVNKRLYTITYDFKSPIKIYLSNGINTSNKTYKSSDLSKQISIVNGITYYINNNLLNSETSVINGNFVNLYGNQALSSDGTIYNIIDKTKTNSLIDYKILDEEVFLYKFNYNGQDIKTYYNYSTIDGVIKDYQIFEKQNNLSIINSNLENKKDSYIIDFYNNKEIQLVLNKNGKLYNLKDEIMYPIDMVNDNIKDLYYNINSNNSLVVLLYETGEIYTFDYKTGTKIFSNRYNVDMSILDYIKQKINTNSSSKTISNISTLNEYEEIKKMEEKLKLTSVEDATNQLSQNNSTINKNTKYITMYNSKTQNYDIYNVETILSLDNDVESENNKIYKDYELVQFYKNYNKEKNNKSLNGLLIFTLTVMSILATLYLLIRHKRIRRLS